MLSSEKFEVCIEGSHSLVIPEHIAAPFIEQNHKRVMLIAFYKDNSLTFHGALHKVKGRYMISFGKRYQKDLGVSASSFFELQLFEDTTEYGVEMPEEFQAVLDSDPEAADIFSSFSDGKKRTLIYFVLRFKNSQTRIDKSLIIAENIKMGITDLKDIVKARFR